MAASDVKVGSFTLNGTTGNQVITGLGFTPKLMIFWAFVTIDTDLGSGPAKQILAGHGAASSPTDHFATFRAYVGGSYSNSLAGFKSDRAFSLYDDETNLEKAGFTIVSFDADGFTIDVKAGYSFVIKYMAIGGDGFVGKVGKFDVPANTSSFNQSITGVGFQPKALMVMTGPENTTDALTDLSAQLIGFATKSSDHVCMVNNLYTDGMSQAWTRLNGSRRFIQLINQNGSPYTNADFGSMDADGFTLKWTGGASITAWRIGYIALGGTIKYDLRVLAQRTTVGSQGVTGLPFSPSGMFMAGINHPYVENTSRADVRWTLGAASSMGPSEISDSWYEPNDNTSSSLPIAVHSTSKAYAVIGNSAGETTSEADLSSFNSDGYTLNWTKVNGAANEIIVLSMGDKLPINLKGDVKVSSVVRGDIKTGISLSASSTVRSTATADLTHHGSVFRAESKSRSRVTADLWVNPALRGASKTSTKITGDITTNITLAGGPSSRTVVTADLTIRPVVPASDAKVRTTIKADLSTRISMSAEIGVPIKMTGELTTFKLIAANVKSSVKASGNLTAPSDVVGMMDFADWLKLDSAVRVILVETTVVVNGVVQAMYLTNRHYVTRSMDVPANTEYESVLTGGIKITEKLGLDSTQTISFGDIELYNIDGSLDHWLDYIWKNRPIKVYIGDAIWMRSKFEKIFDGVISDIGSSSRDRLNIKLRDKLERLNNPIHEDKLGGTTAEKDRLLPLCFGEVHNITPLLVDAPNHVYKVHNGEIKDITEVRDNGIPVTVTKTNSNGTFTMKRAPLGTVTCSVQGDAPSGIYYSDVTSLVKRLATQYGKAADRFVDDEIDHPNFDSFQAINSQAIGTYISDRSNVLSVCQEAAQSIGAQLCVSRGGKLQLKRIDLDFSNPESDIREIGMEHMYAKKISIVNRTEVIAADKVGFAKNWTVQSDLQTAIVEEHKSLYALEWLTETKKLNNVATAYNIDTEPEQRNTMLISRSDAFAECTRRLDILSQPRHVFRFDGVPELITLTLGQRVRLFHTRFGLESGKYGVVVSLSPDWVTGRVQVEVMV